MRMIDVALPKFDDPANSTADLSRHAEPPMIRQTSTFAKKRAADEEEYHLMQEEEEDKDGKEEFFDTEDMLEGVSSSSLTPFCQAGNAAKGVCFPFLT